MAKSIIATALDIGTDSIKGLCLRKDIKTGKIDVLAQLKKQCFGVRNGEVVKPHQVAKAIEEIKAHLSQIAGVKIKEVVVSINGKHLSTILSKGVASVSRADQKISKEDVQRAVQEAETINLPSNNEILDSIAKEFIVDGQGEIKNPIGLKGIRLESKVLLTSVFQPVIENLQKAVEEADLDIINIIPSPIAAARAVLSPQQKELGVCLIDIGAATTSVSVFENGDLVDFIVYPAGSSNITNDIAICLRTEIQTAERIKKEFATLKEKKALKAKEKIKIPEKSLNFSKKLLKNIVEARISEILSEAQKSIKKMSKDHLLPAGIVLTGGGARLSGIVEFTRQNIKLPCKIGKLNGFSLLDDSNELEFSVAAGLALSIFDSFESEDLDNNSITGNFGNGFKEKIKKLFRAFLP